MATDEPETLPRAYTPAAGYHMLTPLYDLGVALTTREKLWRERLVHHMALAGSDILLDVGAGTGNLAAAVARHGSSAAYHGIDPDEAAIAIARRKTRDALPQPVFRTGHFSAEAVRDWPRPNKAALCLVLHQVDLAEKARLLRELWLALADDGELYIADYGAQRSRSMRWLFRLTIQQLDGVRDTQPNADGMLPKLIADAGFDGIREVAQFRTITGSLSIIAAKKAA